MDILKRLLYVFLPLILVACGGGSSEDDTTNPLDSVPLPPSPKFNPAPLTTGHEVAKAAAAVVVANMTFERTISYHYAMLSAFQPVDSSTRQLYCGSYFNKPLFYLITKNNDPAYTSYTSIESKQCNLIDGYGNSGKLVSACSHNDCLLIATDLTYNKADSLFQTVNGLLRSKNNIYSSKGNVKLYVNSLSSVFYFNDGLVNKLYNQSPRMGKDSFGKIGVSNGNALNCTYGEFSYNVISDLSASNKVNGGAIEIKSNNLAVGLVTFNSDGSVTVKREGMAEEIVKQSIFESFCALKEVYSF